MKCVIDQRREIETGQVCDGCRAWLSRTLVEIVELYALLPANLMPGQVQGQRVSGSREAPLPLRVEPLDLGMPARAAEPSNAARAHPEDQIGTMSVASMLDSWVKQWRETRNKGERLPEATVVQLARWLLVRMDDACDYDPTIRDFASELRKVHGNLRAVDGVKSDRVYVGACPVTDDKGTCGAALTADPYLDAIRCPRCDTRWDRDRWLWLGMTIRGGAA